MGYVRDTIFRLHFEAPEMEGLEVRVRSMALAKFLDVDELLAKMRRGETTRQDMEDLYSHFADHLVSWNVETRDEADIVTPVPPTVEGLYDQDFDFVTTIIKAWVATVSGVPSGPLGEASTGGAPSVEASIPMEPSPGNPTS